MNFWWIAPAATALTAAIATGPVIGWLTKRKVLDVANHRSSHEGTAVRGVGLATTVALVVGFFFGGLSADGVGAYIVLVLGGSAVFGAGIGAVEDLHGLSAKARLAGHLLVGLGSALLLLPATEAWMIWGAAAAVYIAWYINVANFMDGLNGISGLHGLVAGGLYALIGLMTGTLWLLVAGSVICVSFGMFLPWNLGRPGTFLGDTGSYLLGTSLAVTGVAALVDGIPLLAVLGPVLIYNLDAGLTLLHRMFRREKWYEPHRDHVYQRMNRSGLTHVQASGVVAIVTAAVGVVGILTLPGGPLQELTAAVLFVMLGAGYWFGAQWLMKQTVRPEVASR